MIRILILILLSGLTVQLQVLPILLGQPAENLDWRNGGCVSAVRDQGQCYSSWAFAAVESVESGHCLASGQLIVDLSVQQLMDCSSSYGNSGCGGGHVDDAYKYIIDNGGIETENTYPYEAKVGVCRASAAINAVNVRSYIDVTMGDEDALLQAVKVQPVAVTIDDSQLSFYNYNQGIYYEPLCSSANVSHAMLVVGYGTNLLGQDYWLVKNSYGAGWGEQGYIRMARNRNNNCGIATQASYPTF